MISKDGFPYNNIWVKEKSVISNNLQSVFLIVLKREDRSLLYMGQWSKKCINDSTPAPHLHTFSESWKLCLNLCSRRWLRPRRSLVRNLIPCGLWHSNTLLGEGLINFRMAFFWVSQIRVEVIPFDNARWKKGVFKEIMIGFKQWNIYVVSGTVNGVPNRNYIE